MGLVKASNPCLSCGEPLPSRNKWARQYCSDACRNAAKARRRPEHGLSLTEADRLIEERDRASWGFSPPWERHPVPWDNVRGRA